MIPESQEVSTQINKNEVFPTKTYKIDFVNKRIIGMIDGREAVIQFIRKVMSTDKYAFEIYNWYYGNEVQKLLGQPYDYVVTRIPNIFRQALLVDERIKDVRDFTFTRTHIDSVSVSCVIDTVYGEIVHKQEVVL